LRTAQKEERIAGTVDTDPALRKRLQWEMQQVLGKGDATLRQKLVELRGVDGHA
jgi:hypothetical protein